MDHREENIIGADGEVIIYRNGTVVPWRTLSDPDPSFGAAIAIVPVHVVLVAVRDAIAMTWPDMHRPAADLGAMRQGSVLVNTSRSGLIAAGALLDGLNAGRPGMAALDVFDTEPLTNVADPLMSHPNVICTPHIGFVTQDELDMQFGDIYDQINAYAQGAPIHLANPEISPKT